MPKPIGIRHVLDAMQQDDRCLDLVGKVVGMLQGQARTWR